MIEFLNAHPLFHHLVGMLVVSLAVQALFFAFASAFKSDKVTDLSYGLTFVLLAFLLVGHARVIDHAPWVLAVMVMTWGVRLAGYLFYRILSIGRDARFDGVREHFWSFLKFWLFQGIAVWVIMLPATIWFTDPGPWSLWMVPGIVIWLTGLVIEAVADQQKFRFKQTTAGRHRWTDVGLWSLARHPNYFGELLVWWGVFLFTVKDLGWWAAVGILGPLAITVILIKGTGIPTLEASAQKKWGSDPDYQAYRARTRLLVPLRKSLNL